VRPPVTVAVGDTRPSRSIGPITATHIVRFAGAGGDFNPLHHDPAVAARAGFPGVIAMGQLPAGILAGWVSDWLGVEHVLSFEVRFVAPLLVGDTLTLGGRVTAVDTTDGPTVATIQLQGTKGDGAVVLTGSARAVTKPT
jgi:3-hydroxybutyryl-CoA dehydratase